MIETTHDATFQHTRAAIHRVAVHIVARARHQATGRFSLRVTPGGLGTPDLPDDRRVRISGGHLVVESDVAGEAAAHLEPIDGASLRDLAALARVDLQQPLDVGHDTPSIGDIDAPISIDRDAAAELGGWYAVIAAVLDRTLAALAVDGLGATMPRLWPEHFDVAIESDVGPGRRVNLGGTPGDAFSPAPYCYVGPWDGHRPGDPSYWNAPFGAFQVLDARTPETVDAAVDFLIRGIAQLR